MSGYWLAPHIVACETAAGAIFLDLQRNRYAGLALPALPKLADCVHDWPHRTTVAPVPAGRTATSEDPCDPIASLVAAQYIVKHEPASPGFIRRRVDLDSPLATVQDSPVTETHLQWRHVVRFAHACLWAQHALRRRSLYSIACELSQRKQCAVRRPRENDVAPLVHLFCRLRPFAFTARDRCLFHALALSHFLNAHGVFAVWVIGVRTLPWAAHSWVQLDSCLLDATPEQVCEYTPILAV